VAELQAEIRALTGSPADGAEPRLRYSGDGARALKAQSFELGRLRELGYRYEALDQLTAEVLMGVD
jgi:hypothetical protein